jgi:hypothetical protein
MGFITNVVGDGASRRRLSSFGKPNDRMSTSLVRGQFIFLHSSCINFYLTYRTVARFSDDTLRLQPELISAKVQYLNNYTTDD